MLTNLFVGIPYLLTKGFLLGPSLWLWKRWMKLYSCDCAHWRRVCWGWWRCSLLPAPVFLFPSVQTSDKIQLGDAGDGAQLLLRYCVCPLQSPSAVSAAGQCWLYLVLVTILSLATILQRQHHIYCHNYTPTTFITAAAPDTHYLSYWTGRGHNIHISIISTTCLLYLSLLGSGCWIYIAWYLPCFI